jgi:hypothetical protein
MDKVFEDLKFDNNPSKNKVKIKYVTELLKQRYNEDPQEYFNFLKSHEEQRPDYFICDTAGLTSGNNVKSIDSYEVLSFRTYICELFYRAIRMFPEISEYTIETKNNVNKCILVIGVSDELDDQNEKAMCKVITDFDTYVLNKFEIYALYSGNKITNPDYDVINALIISLQMGGLMPKITTSYKINPKFVKNATKN